MTCMVTPPGAVLASHSWVAQLNTRKHVAPTGGLGLPRSEELAMHGSLGANELSADGEHLCTHASEHEPFQAIYCIKRRMQCDDNHSIILMRERHQVVRASPHAKRIKKFYEYEERATDVYQDLWLVCKRHW